MSPILLLLPLLQEPAVPSQAPPALDLRQAPVVAEADRICLTPKIDGKIEDEEWDALGQSGDVKTFLQWEPGALHVAAAGAAGRDVLVSIDPDGDGWLVGRNNLEARIGLRDGKPFVRLRLLDATNVAGPAYREIAGLEAASSAAIGPDGTVEVTLVDPGLMLLPRKAGRLSARVDVIRSDEASLPSNEPRSLAPLNLRDERAAALPGGLKSKVDFNDIAAVPGESVSVRFSFTGEPMPQRIALRTEGLGRLATSATELPFPAAGKKGASVDYRSRIQPDATVGYRIARATLMGSDGVPAVVQASYRVAPLVDVALKETTLKASDKDRSIRMGFVVTGNSRGRMTGRAAISAPGAYRVTNGTDEQKLILAEPRQGLPKGFDFFVPANAKGTVPITFSLEIDKKKLDVVRYVTIE